jgi:hypothetical protein
LSDIGNVGGDNKPVATGVQESKVDGGTSSISNRFLSALEKNFYTEVARLKGSE